jgi:hypothetical protein
MSVLVCSDRLHATRSAVPGWSDSLGTSTQPVSGALCVACASARVTEATEGDADTDNYFVIKQGVGYRFVLVRKYDGEIVGFREFGSTLAAAVTAGAITTTERNNFLALLVKLRDHAKAVG